MTNRYYNETFAAALGTQAKSSALEAQFRLIQQGFDLLNLENDEVLGRDGNFSSLGQVPPSMAINGVALAAPQGRERSVKGAPRRAGRGSRKAR